MPCLMIFFLSVLFQTKDGSCMRLNLEQTGLRRRYFTARDIEYPFGFLCRY